MSKYTVQLLAGNRCRQIDICEKIKVENRSVKGAIHFRPSLPVTITKEEYEYISKEEKSFLKQLKVISKTEPTPEKPIENSGDENSGSNENSGDENSGSNENSGDGNSLENSKPEPQKKDEEKHQPKKKRQKVKNQ
jgi:hypothetical protein